MLAITWSSSRVCSNSVPSIFYAIDLEKLYEEKTVQPIASFLDELALDVSLDLSKHQIATLLDLSTIYTFANVNKFHQPVTKDGAGLLHLLALMVDYNIASYVKFLAKYGKWRKKLQKQAKLLCKIWDNLILVEYKLHQSQEKFANMQQEQDCLWNKLALAKTQIKSLHHHNFAKDLEL